MKYLYLSTALCESGAPAAITTCYFSIDRGWKAAPARKEEFINP